MARLVFIERAGAGHLVFLVESGKYKGRHIAFWGDRPKAATLDEFFTANHGDVAIEVKDSVLEYDASHGDYHFALAQKCGFQ